MPGSNAYRQQANVCGLARSLSIPWWRNHKAFLCIDLKSNFNVGSLIPGLG